MIRLLILLMLLEMGCTMRPKNIQDLHQKNASEDFRRDIMKVYENWYTGKDSSSFVNGRVIEGMPMELAAILYGIPTIKRKDYWLYISRGKLVIGFVFLDEKIKKIFYHY